MLRLNDYIGVLGPKNKNFLNIMWSLKVTREGFNH